MNRLGDARTRLLEAIAPVLPGRVEPYPPETVARLVAPMVWIDQPSVRRETVGRAIDVIAATFPLWVLYDGAVHAQVAGLDDVIAALWDACEAATGIEPRQALPRALPNEVQTLLTRPPVERPDRPRLVSAAVLDVAVTITARTFCVPDAVTATVPPPTVIQPEEALAHA